MATIAHSGGGYGRGGHETSDISGGPESSNHMAHMPVVTLWIVYFALLGLLGLTVLLYYVDFQKMTHITGLNLVIALVVACIKATLVVWFFMNVKNATRLTWLWAGLGFIWLLLMAGVFMDYQSRAWVEAPGWQ